MRGLQDEREREKEREEGTTRSVDNEGLEAMVERVVERRVGAYRGEVDRLRKRVEELEASLAASGRNRDKDEDNKPFVVEEEGYTFPPVRGHGSYYHHGYTQAATTPTTTASVSRRPELGRRRRSSPGWHAPSTSISASHSAPLSTATTTTTTTTNLNNSKKLALPVMDSLVPDVNQQGTERRRSRSPRISGLNSRERGENLDGVGVASTVVGTGMDVDDDDADEKR